MIDRNSLSFVHIGKCGGSTVLKILENSAVPCEDIHLRKPVLNRETNYIIWVRNPLKRFVSAFNFVYDIIHSDINHLKGKELTLENCLAPEKIRKKIETGHAYQERYEYLIDFFGTANNLAESLTHRSLDVRVKAQELMNRKEEHIYKGIGWYLSNGKFIKQACKNILFVGRCEHMSYDINVLSTLLGRRLDHSFYVRKNPTSQPTHLSERAVRNLLRFYKRTDYRALKVLYRYNFIDKPTINSYYNV